MVLSGGLSYDTVGRRACLTVMHGKSTTVLEMDYPIVDFLTLCETPYPNGEKRTCAVDEARPCDDAEVLFVWFRFSGALRRGGPPREGFSCNRPWTNRVNRFFIITNCLKIVLFLVLF